MRGELKPELIESLKTVAAGKNVDSEIIMDSLKEALITAARKYTGIPKRFHVNIDPETSEIHVLLSVEVVDDYPDYDEDMSAEEVAKFDESYMLLDEATDYNEDAEIGDMLEMEIPIAGFGRMAIQTAKQILMQKVRDAERLRIVSDYEDRIGTIVSGEVQQIDRGNILIKLGKTEAVLPAREQIRKERFRQGETVQAYISEVSDSARGAQVVLSRSHKNFLAELFKIEVPEIYDGIVNIESVSRDPGFRAKIAVSTIDEKIDPVGACVGMKGNRVQTIVRELSNERIDIVLWHADLQTYVKRSLAPAEVSVFKVVESTTRIVVVVPDDDLSQVIGRSGQNVRLASQLVGRALDIFGESDWNALSEAEREKVLEPRENDRPMDTSVEATESQDKYSELDALFNKENEADA